MAELPTIESSRMWRLVKKSGCHTYFLASGRFREVKEIHALRDDPSLMAVVKADFQRYPHEHTIDGYGNWRSCSAEYWLVAIGENDKRFWACDRDRYIHEDAPPPTWETELLTDSTPAQS